MKWLEIIKLRSSGIEEGMWQELLRSLASSGQLKELAGIKAYRHSTLKNDISVHLHWESDRVEQNGTELGLRVVQALNEFGFIDHSTWVEEHNGSVFE